ncbi:hypothetical protein CLU79DRAFT_723457 [Phycomyces nitens]|nr:hypothetical protein CLU79DRAFT_723457 [Phycomyces nitens]
MVGDHCSSVKYHVASQVRKTRRKATTDGLTGKGSRIIASPGFSSDENIVKVSLYDIPAYQVEIDLCDPLKHAMEPYGKIIHIRAYVDRHGQSRWEATVFLEISVLSPIRPLQLPSTSNGTPTTPVDSASPTTPTTITTPSPQQDEDIDILNAKNVTSTPAASYTAKVITIFAGKIDELMADPTGNTCNSNMSLADTNEFGKPFSQ